MAWNPTQCRILANDLRSMRSDYARFSHPLKTLCLAWERIRQTANYEAKSRALADAIEALETLVDHQNGCPLPKYEAEWTRAMTLAYKVLGRGEFKP